MPALAVALDLTVGHQLGHHAVQVVRLDLQLLGDLGDGDPGLAANQLEGLIGPGVTSAATARSAGTAAAAPPLGTRGARRTPRSAPGSEQGGTGGLELETSSLSARNRPSMSFTVVSTKSATDFSLSGICEKNCGEPYTHGVTAPYGRVFERGLRSGVKTGSACDQSRSSSAFKRLSEPLASRSEAAPTITRLATFPSIPPGGVNSLEYLNSVRSSPRGESS